MLERLGKKECGAYKFMMGKHCVFKNQSVKLCKVVYVSELQANSGSLT